MTTVNITNAGKLLYQLGDDVNTGYNPITIVNNKGKNAELESRTKELLGIMGNDPFQNPPGCEKLQGDLRGLYFRRISGRQRLVYMDALRKYIAICVLRIE